MRKLIIISFLLLCFISSIIGQSISPRIANYKIHVRLDTENKMLHGEQKIFWQNPSSDTIKELRFHLYYNAFKNKNSTFFSGRPLEGFLGSSEYGHSEVTNIVDADGNQLHDQSYYDHPDDDNVDDQTVLVVPLKNAILPFGLAEFDMTWLAKIPKTMPRTGYNKDFYFFAQWFPKLGVYEPAGMRYAQQGQWNCHQYHASGEYYADFGNYDVSMTLPKEFVIASSGTLISQINDGENQTWNFRIEDVIDFTWSCSPHFLIEERIHNGVKLKYYAYPYKLHFADRYFETLTFAMDYLNTHLDSYPYHTLSVVDAPFYGMFCGGMEYPTLVSSISFCFFPKGVRIPQTLVAHEYIHQYFMQLVATNETEEPWMDEGITTYYEGRIMDALFPGDSASIDVLGFHVGNAEYNRTEFFGSPHVKSAANTTKSWEFDQGGYSAISYNKTAIWLKTLEGILGIEKMDEIMRTYFLRWKYKHPCKDDFVDVVNEVTGKDMYWYFDQVLEDVSVCDYAIDNIYIEEKDTSFTSFVFVKRLEQMKLPQEILIVFEDGSSVIENWDGKSPTKTYEYDKQVVSAEIDPSRKIYIDKNFLNNSKSVKKSKGVNYYFSRFLLTAQNALESMSFLS